MKSDFTIGNISFELVDPQNEKQVERVHKVLDRAPRYYERVEGVSTVSEEMLRREIEETVPKKKQTPTYEKHFLLIYLDKLPIGVVDLHKDHPSKGYTYLGLLLFDEKYQSKGWGGKAYPLIENYCREELGANTVILGVADDNDVSDFWKKMGFEYNGKTYTWTGTNKEVSVQEMEKELVQQLPKL
jgi:RimJ/RimL family protein N-acetyltransferase